MSRHRNVRTLNVQEEYDGYFDVYGHSVEDDYCISPSVAEFMYDRNRKHQISSLLSDESQIKEDEEWNNSEQDLSGPAAGRSSFSMPTLSDDEEVKLKSCLDELRSIVGDSIPESILVESVLKYEFDFEKSLQDVLSQSTSSGSQASCRKLGKLEDCLNNHCNELSSCLTACSLTDSDVKKESGSNAAGCSKTMPTAVNPAFLPLNPNQSTFTDSICISSSSAGSETVASGSSPLQSLATHHMKTAPKVKLFGLGCNESSPIQSKISESPSKTDIVYPTPPNTSQLQTLALGRLQLNKPLGSTLVGNFFVPRLFTDSSKNNDKNCTVVDNPLDSSVKTGHEDLAECCILPKESEEVLVANDHQINLALAVKLSNSCNISRETINIKKHEPSTSNYHPDFHICKLLIPVKLKSPPSSTGKLLSSRLKSTFSFPFDYWSLFNSESNVTRFMFTVPSPDEIVTNLRKPSPMLL